MKKCIEFCSIASDFPGSFIKCMHKLMRESQKENMKIEFVFPYEAKDKIWCKNLMKETKVYFISAKKASLNLKTYVEIYKILKNNNYDIIHSHYESFDINLFIMKKILKLKSRLIFHLHDCPLEHLNDVGIFKSLYYQLKYILFTKNVEIIAINKKNEETVKKFSKKCAYTKLLYNGISFDDLKYNNSISTIQTFITLGWDFYVKGDDLILKAADILFKKGYKFKLIINGNDTTFQQIKKFLKCDIPKYIEFQQPVIDRNDFFNKGNIFLQASRNETFSFGVCEASYAGKVVICSNIPGMSWSFYLPNVNTFESESYESLACEMEKYLKNPSLFSFDKEFVRNEIMNNFSDEIWIKNMIEIYIKGSR